MSYSRAILRVLVAATALLFSGQLIGPAQLQAQDEYVYPNPYNPDFGWLPDELMVRSLIPTG
jgi:hypothetical protein